MLKGGVINLGQGVINHLFRHHVIKPSPGGVMPTTGTSQLIVRWSDGLIGHQPNTY